MRPSKAQQAHWQQEDADWMAHLRQQHPGAAACLEALSAQRQRGEARMPYVIGEEVFWKRAGAQGYYCCRVVAIREGTARPYTIEVVKHEWWGATTLSGARRHVTAASLYLRRP
jgi:hypothetical protein